MNWANAINFCDKLGAHLVAIETEEEYDVIKQIIMSNEGKAL